MKSIGIKEEYTVKELSTIFQLSTKSTVRHLRHFDIPVQTKERFKSHIKSDLIKYHNQDLYTSMELAIVGKVVKPFYSVRDLCPMFRKTHSGMYRWLKRYGIPTRICGNKTVLLASVLLQLMDSAPK